MPASIGLDEELKARTVAFSGVVSAADVERVTNAISASDDPGMDVVVDTRDVDRVAADPALIRSIAGRRAREDSARLRTPGRVAVVASKDFAFGMARMYETYIDLTGRATRYGVFRTMDEAIAWLRRQRGEETSAPD